MGIQKFTSTINKEGSTGSVRGKIPASLIAEIGAKEGDVVEFHVNKGTIVGAHVMTGKEARQFRAQGRAGSAPKSSGNGKVKKKVVGKSASSEKAQKAGKKSSKSSKNKTSVKVSKSKVKGKKGRVEPRFSL